MGFEKADAALDQALSQQQSGSSASNAPTSDSAPEAGTSTAPNTNEAQSAEAAAQKLIELDKLEKFSYAGKEWTLKDLQKSMMLQSDYTKKTQELSAERKYYDNLAIDLERVKNDPTLVQAFKETYPEKFHSYLKYATPQEQAQKDQQQQQIDQAKEVYKNDPTIMRKLETLEQSLQGIQKNFHEKEVEAATIQLESMYSEFKQKYPMADENSVTATAIALDQSGQKLDKSTIEQVFKDDHAKHESRYKAFYANQIKQQKKANASAKDVGSGGEASQSVPKKMTFDQVTEHLIGLQRQGQQ